MILVERQAFAPYAEVRDEHEDDRCAGRALLGEDAGAPDLINPAALLADAVVRHAIG